MEKGAFATETSHLYKSYLPAETLILMVMLILNCPTLQAADLLSLPPTANALHVSSPMLKVIQSLCPTAARNVTCSVGMKGWTNQSTVLKYLHKILCSHSHAVYNLKHSRQCVQARHTQMTSKNTGWTDHSPH